MLHKRKYDIDIGTRVAHMRQRRIVPPMVGILGTKYSAATIRPSANYQLRTKTYSQLMIVEPGRASFHTQRARAR
jgi:hypothetical protein